MRDYSQKTSMAMTLQQTIRDTKILNWLNSFVLIGSLMIIASLSYDILTAGHYRPDTPLTLRIQLFVCSIFIVDFFVRLIIADRKWRFVRRNMLLLIFSIPFLNIIRFEHLGVPAEIHYLIGFLPLLRGGFGLIIITRWFTKRSATSLVVSYLSILAAMTYFASLIFFVAEKGSNSLVSSYWDALWWACMDLTTVGSNIIATTTIGKIMSVILAGMGMMMLPIFTVYITDRVVISKNERDQAAAKETLQDAEVKAAAQSDIDKSATAKPSTISTSI